MGVPEEKNLRSALADIESTIAMVRKNLDHGIPVVAVPVADLAKRSVDAVVAAKAYEATLRPAWEREDG